jgi:hypothetical protein
MTAAVQAYRLTAAGSVSDMCGMLAQGYLVQSILGMLLVHHTQLDCLISYACPLHGRGQSKQGCHT